MPDLYQSVSSKIIERILEKRILSSMKFISYYKKKVLLRSQKELRRDKREPNHNAAVVCSDTQGHRSTNIGEIPNLGQHRGNPEFIEGARRD